MKKLRCDFCNGDVGEGSKIDLDEDYVYCSEFCYLAANRFIEQEEDYYEVDEEEFVEGYN